MQGILFQGLIHMIYDCDLHRLYNMLSNEWTQKPFHVPMDHFTWKCWKPISWQGGAEEPNLSDLEAAGEDAVKNFNSFLSSSNMKWMRHDLNLN